MFCSLYFFKLRKSVFKVVCELQKVLIYKDWRNFQKVMDKVVLSANNIVLSKEDWVVEINKPIKNGKVKEEIMKKLY